MTDKRAPNWVVDEGWVTGCPFEVDPGSQRFFEPPETCGHDVRQGEEFCPTHTEYSEDYGRGSFDECYDFQDGAF